MKFGVDVSQHHMLWDEILDRVRFGEQAGFDGAWVFDHFKPLYGNSVGPCYEGWTLLAALAASTERIRLGILVTGVTYRHPSVLAAEAAVIDHVSNGRLEFAIGAAWFDGEHNELGIDFPGNRERIERLDEAIDVIRLLMTEAGASYDGKYYSLKNATYEPKPIQQPHPPIWVGGTGEKLMLPLVARQADVWHGFGNLADLKRRAEILDRHAEKAGRDPAAIKRSTALSLSEDWTEVRERIDAVDDMGFSYLTCSWPSEGKARLEEFVEKVMPDYV
jgi:F420-dependent oxidoreductase-like protein